MDESLQELENELKALRPRRPSVLLRAQIERGLADDAVTRRGDEPRATRYTSATSLRSWKWAGWRLAGGVAAAAAIAFFVWQSHDREPAAPSDALAARPEPAGVMPDERAAGAGVDAAAVAAAGNVYRPVKAANVLYDLRDEGAVTLENDVAGRRVRARYVDTYTFRNPVTNASLKVSVPRDEVRILPASFH